MSLKVDKTHFLTWLVIAPKTDDEVLNKVDYLRVIVFSS